MLGLLGFSFQDVYIYTCVYVYMHIEIYRERERENMGTEPKKRTTSQRPGRFVDKFQNIPVTNMIRRAVPVRSRHSPSFRLSNFGALESSAQNRVPKIVVVVSKVEKQPKRGYVRYKATQRRLQVATWYRPARPHVK